MEIKKVMNKEVLTLKPDDTLSDAVKLFGDNKIGGAPVVDNHNRLVGIISEYDIIKMLKTKTTRLSMVFPSSHSLGLTFQESIVYKEIQDAFKDISHMEVRDLMSTEFKTAKENDQLEDVAPELLKEHVKRLPIVDENNKLVGIITRRDIIRGLIAEK